jgi:molecular chaperone GrpE
MSEQKQQDWKERLNPWSRKADRARGGNKEKDTMSTEQMEHESNAAQQEPELEASTTAETSETNELEQLRAERDTLAQQLAQAQDRFARLQAEFDNARKREIKERADTRDYATQAAIEPFLGVMDNFALALAADGDVAQLRAGVQLILKQMEEALRSLNVQSVEAVGTQFDPRVHEALGSVETVEHPDHSVLEEIRRGYKLRDKLLRPALVRIAINNAQKSE